MAESSSAKVDILIVGAGPTGLTAAAEAIRNGLTTKIIDVASSRAPLSRAMVIHSRTMECLRSIDQTLAQNLVEEGVVFNILNVYTGTKNAGKVHKPSAKVEFGKLDWGDAEFPFWLSIPQYETERILEEYLTTVLEKNVDWGVGLDTFAEKEGDSSGVTATLTNGDIVSARWIIGCDGGRSKTAKIGGIEMKRSSLGLRLFLADAKTSCSELLNREDQGRLFLGSSDGALVLFPMKGDVYRIMGIVKKEDAELNAICAETKNFCGDIPKDVQSRAIEFIDELVSHRTGLDYATTEVSWFSQFELSEGVRDHYRSSTHPSCFIAGDAAHVHSPAGGQGMNTGVQDAHNLVWKLAAVTRLEKEMSSDASLDSTSIADYKYLIDRILSSYESERSPPTHKMVETTSKATTNVTKLSNNILIRKALSFLVPILIPRVRNNFGRRVGMLELSYEGGPIIEHKPGCGERVPNPKVDVDGSVQSMLNKTSVKGMGKRSPEIRLHDILLLSKSRGHVLIEFGGTNDTESCTCKAYFFDNSPGEVSLKCAQIDYNALREHFGMSPGSNTVILIRPDLYVAGVWSSFESMTKSELFGRCDGGGSYSFLNSLQIPTTQ